MMEQPVDPELMELCVECMQAREDLARARATKAELQASIRNVVKRSFSLKDELVQAVVARRESEHQQKILEELPQRQELIRRISSIHQELVDVQRRRSTLHEEENAFAAASLRSQQASLSASIADLQRKRQQLLVAIEEEQRKQEQLLQRQNELRKELSALTQELEKARLCLSKRMELCKSLARDHSHLFRRLNPHFGSARRVWEESTDQILETAMAEKNGVETVATKQNPVPAVLRDEDAVAAVDAIKCKTKELLRRAHGIPDDECLKQNEEQNQFYDKIRQRRESEYSALRNDFDSL